MAKKPEDVIRQKKEKILKALDGYTSSPDFNAVAASALVDFIKRVKRGLMPSLGAIDGLSKDYKDFRKKNSKDLGELGKPNKSNATATGQMLGAMKKKADPNGFTLYVDDTSRNGELGGRGSKITNGKVSEYYALTRKIFELSDPENKRIIRNIKKHISDLIKKSK